MKLLRIILAVILSAALVASLAACETPQAKPTSAPTETTQHLTETMSTTQPQTTTTLLETSIEPSTKPSAPPTVKRTTTTAAIRKSAVDMSDEAHAIESLRAFYFANRDLFNSIKDDLWAMEGYEYCTFGKQADGSDWYSARIRDGNDTRYASIEPDDTDPVLKNNLRQYFAALGPGCMVSLTTWGSPGKSGRDRVVDFEYGFLQSIGNEIVGIVYSPNYRDYFVEELEANWYIYTTFVVF